ncbi:hypothetical protein AVEN_107594-1 [Araneus ventricosus]|uniref:Uncharacterized protein n=1 Tax=Araneus ventricosus TaxID=182803 RepID=A0A4Y2U075_ARAVE|nr:hypothetical protein AVEN_107594-1 [Araneus ventricosus]
MKKIWSEFFTKSLSLVGTLEHLSILNIYEEVTEVMAFADDFLSYYAFIFVVISMSGLFWFTYIFVFLKQGNYYTYVFIFSGVVYYLLVLLSVILPAAAVNEAAEIAKSNILFMESWIPKPYRDSKIYLRQKLKQSVEMTLWKIYKVDKSLFITSLGTLLTYGMLLGTLGSVNKQNNMSSQECTNKV